MGPRALAWLVCLPLAAAGTLMAHTVAYVVAEPDAERRATMLARTGHGYLDHVPVVGLLALVGVIAAVWMTSREAARGRTPWTPSPRLFAGLPPLLFALQEHLERALESGAVPLHAATEPTFLLGLALQAPFALCAYAAARALLVGARAAGRCLAGRRPLAVTLALPGGRVERPVPPVLRRPQPLASRAAGRGPPLVVLV